MCMFGFVGGCADALVDVHIYRLWLFSPVSQGKKIIFFILFIMCIAWR